MENRPAMTPIEFDMYNFKSRESDMTARLGEVRKATVHKVQAMEEPRVVHYYITAIVHNGGG